MENIEIWEYKMKEKIKSMDFRTYLKTLCSWSGITFYKHGKLISVYPQTDRIQNLYSPSDFEKNNDLSNSDGINFDFEKDFFSNYKKLLQSIPLMSLRQFPPISNSFFTDASGRGANDCYLVIGVCMDSSNVLYSFEVKENCYDILGSVMVWENSNNVYQSNCVINSSNIFYSRFVLNSSNIWFCSNLIGCHDCLFSDNLENKSYCINNIQVSKTEYFIEKEKILKHKNMFYSWYFTKVSIKGNNHLSSNVTGLYVTNSNNVENGYFSNNIFNGKNIILSGTKNGNKNLFNAVVSGSPVLDDSYNVLNSGFGSNMFCSDLIVQGSNIYYSYLLENCTFCLGCIGLKNKSFCILNIQYSKEEWYLLANKIFESMDNDGILGDFFPGSINPFYFNDTMAYLIDDSFTKIEVEKDGYMWRDEKIKVDIPDDAEVVFSSELARKNNYLIANEMKQSNNKEYILDNFHGFNKNGKWQINKEILKKVIVDENGNYYKIVEKELEFLIKHGLPLPETYWLDRIKMGFKFK